MWEAGNSKFALLVKGRWDRRAKMPEPAKTSALPKEDGGDAALCI